MSSSLHDTESAAPLQGVSWNEEDWQGMLKRLPSNWQEQAVKLKAWQRVRKLVQVSDLLRALLVYAACGYSFRQLGLWATLVGVGCLSERAWRKRVERAQEWIAWLLGALIGSQVSPGWLPSMPGRILLLDASRLKVPAGSGEDVRMHSAYDLQAGRLVQVEVTDRHHAEAVREQPGQAIESPIDGRRERHLPAVLLHEVGDDLVAGEGDLGAGRGDEDDRSSRCPRPGRDRARSVAGGSGRTREWEADNEPAGMRKAPRAF